MSRLSAALVALAACAHGEVAEARRVITLHDALEALPDTPLNMPDLPKAQLTGHVVMVSFIAT